MNDFLKNNDEKQIISHFSGNKFLPAREPVARPSVNPDFENLNAVRRISESFWYMILYSEYVLFPKGELRQWIKINLRIALYLIIPVFIFIPLITYTVTAFANISEYIVKCLENILHFSVIAVIIVSVLYSLCLAFQKDLKFIFVLIAITFTILWLIPNFSDYFGSW